METKVILSAIESKAIKAGFEFYSDFLHPNKFEYPNVSQLVMTCTKGKYSGEVIDVDYNYRTGEVIKVTVSSQFKGQEPMFKIN